MATFHYYVFGNGRAAEKDPSSARSRFLSAGNADNYERLYAKTAGVLAAQGVPFRIDEMNSCWDGGARDASDTYASTLWSLDWDHWWAAHHIAGINYHTGELLGADGKYLAPNYASFMTAADGVGFDMRPIAYAHLAFTQGAQGQPLETKTVASRGSNLTVYAYRQCTGVYSVTLINKSFGDKAGTASVSVTLPVGAEKGAWEQLNLVQKDQDVAAKSGIRFGGASVDAQGNWEGRWEEVLVANPQQITVQVPPASATVLRFAPQH